MSHEDHSDDILRYLDTHGVVDKDAVFGRKKKKRGTGGRKRGARARREVLDLHGDRADTAEMRLREAVHRCHRRGMKELLIIHGQGLHSDPSEGPVLKRLVRTMLEHELAPFVTDIIPARPREGGGGAVVVRLR
jgi:DNA-nicking Smr family endonuclease